MPRFPLYDEDISFKLTSYGCHMETFMFSLPSLHPRFVLYIFKLMMPKEMITPLCFVKGGKFSMPMKKVFSITQINFTEVVK